MIHSKNIVLVAPAGIGGIPSWCRDIGMQFLIHGYSITLIWEQDRANPVTTPEMPSEFIQINFWSGRFVNQHWALKKLSEILKNANIIFPNTSALTLKAISLIRENKPFTIAVCHSLDEHDLGTISNYEFICDIICALSNHMSIELKKRIPETGHKKLRLIRHGVEESKNTLTRNFEGDLQLIYAGKLDENKRPELLIEILKKIRNNNISAKMVIAGNGPLLDIIVNQAHKFGLYNYIDFLGFISKSQLSEYLNKSHIVLLLSESEGFGLTALEGMQVGVVPIITNSVGMSEIIRNGINGFIVEKNNAVNESVNIILNLNNDRTSLKTISVECEKFINDNFLLDNVVNQYLQIISNSNFLAQTSKTNYIPITHKLGLLDSKLIPTWFTYFIRYTIRQQFKKLWIKN